MSAGRASPASAPSIRQSSADHLAPLEPLDLGARRRSAASRPIPSRPGSGASASDATCGRCVMHRTCRALGERRGASRPPRARSRRRRRHRPRRRRPSAPATGSRRSSARASRATARRRRRSRAAARPARRDSARSGTRPCPRPGAPKPLARARGSSTTSNAASVHRQLRRARRARPLASRGRLARAARSAPRARSARRAALQLASSRRRRSPALTSRVALGAAALGVLEHGCDRAAVLALQPGEQLEALLDLGEPPGSASSESRVAAQLAARGPGARRRRRQRAASASRRASAPCARRARGRDRRERPAAAPTSPRSRARSSAAAAAPRASPPRRAARARLELASSSLVGRDLLDLPRSRTRAGRGHARARRAARAARRARARSRAARRQRALEARTPLEVLPAEGVEDLELRRGDHRACGARAGRRRRPGATPTAPRSFADTERP